MVRIVITWYKHLMLEYHAEFKAEVRAADERCRARVAVDQPLSSPEPNSEEEKEVEGEPMAMEKVQSATEDEAMADAMGGITDDLFTMINILQIPN